MDYRLRGRQDGSRASLFELNEFLVDRQLLRRSLVEINRSLFVKLFNENLYASIGFLDLNERIEFVIFFKKAPFRDKVRKDL